MIDFNHTARSPLCMMPSNNDDARDLLLAGIDTLGHIKALLRSIAEKSEGGEMLMIDTAADATGHALALLTKSLELTPRGETP